MSAIYQIIIGILILAVAVLLYVLGNLRTGHAESAKGTGTDIRSDLLYDRCCRWMEKDKPYLNPDLSISEAARALYTNKAYLSKAINTHAGVSFPNFVNRYRIRHAVSAFKDNTTMTVDSLTRASGFSNPTTFSNAFNKVMGENPGTWCARVRKDKRRSRGRTEGGQSTIPPPSLTLRHQDPGVSSMKDLNALL